MGTRNHERQNTNTQRINPTNSMGCQMRHIQDISKRCDGKQRRITNQIHSRTDPHDSRNEIFKNRKNQPITNVSQIYSRLYGRPVKVCLTNDATQIHETGIGFVIFSGPGTNQPARRMYVSASTLRNSQGAEH